MQIFLRRFSFFIIICFFLPSFAFAANQQSYVGTWKLEKIKYLGGKDWRKADYPFTMKLFPNGKFLILMPPRPMIRITGTWKTLDDGRLQISEESENNKPIKPPSISVFNLENGKLCKLPSAYINENQKAQLGEILRRERK